MARNGGFVAKSQALSLRDEVLLTASFFLTNCKLLHKLNPLGKLGVKITWSIQCTALVSNEIHSVLLGTHLCPQGVGCVLGCAANLLGSSLSFLQYRS